MLMLSRLRHIGKMLLVALLVMSCTSCARWREAKAVVKEADRLLVYGNIIEDTAVLAATINTFSGPMGYVFARNNLANAYYHMARNFYHAHDYATAADYYILCDRLNPTDPMYKGRVNSCMGFLCKQDSCFEEALEFYQRSSCAFKESGNEWYYAHNLVNVAEQYVNLREYAKADSVLDIANDYDIDSAYYARIVDVRALALFNQQLYDSALVCLLSIENYPRDIEARCYSYMKIMHCYEFLNQLDNAIIYAEYIIGNSKNPAYRSNAYFFLIEAEKVNQDMQRVVNYSHLREDENRNIRTPNESCAQATMKFKAYLNESGYTNLIISIIVSLFFILGVGIWLIYKCYCGVLQKHAKEKQDRRDLLARRIYDHSIYFTSWQDYKKLRELANSHFNNMFYQLEDTYHLSEQEIKICLMVLLEYTNKQMAEILFVQSNTISKAKNKIAKQLNTSSAELRAYLIDILA